MGYKAIVLAGGEGTRLRPLTIHKTKPTRFVDGIPIIGHVLNSLERSGVDEAYIAIAYKLTDVITTVETKYKGVDYVFYHPHTNPEWEVGDPKPSFKGTADAIRQAPNGIREYDPLIIASGDHVHNLPLEEAVEKHEWNVKNHDAYATIIGVRKPKDAIVGRLGQFDFDEKTNLIRDFKEKPDSIEKVSSDIGNAGIYIASNKLMRYIEDNPHLTDFGKHVFGEDIIKDKRLYAHIFGDEYVWNDVGVLEDFRLANLAVSQGIEGIKRGYRYDEKTNCSFGKDCSIHGEVRNSVIGDHVFIDKGSKVTDSVIGDNNFIIGTDVRESITDKRVIMLQTKGAKKVAIGESVELDYGTKISPDPEDLEKHDGYLIIYPNMKIKEKSVVKNSIKYPIEYFSS